MASVNQKRPHCVNQMGKAHSKPLAERHAMCESAFTVFLIKSFTAHKIYLHGARSGIEPESPVHNRTLT